MFLKKTKHLNIYYVYDIYMVNNKDGNKITLTLSIRECVWKRFKKYCKDNDLTPSYEIQNYMRDEML